MNNGVGAEVENVSGDESDPSSLEFRISDDSGIEDWDDDMTVQTGQDDEGAILEFAEEKKEQRKESPEREEAGERECIFPMLPDKYEESESIRKDILDEKAISGVCGLINLGNTCFINASIQSLVATKILRKLVLQGDILQNGSDHMHEPAAVLLFVERFQELVHKVLSGKYSLLYPAQLHSTISKLHSSFGDYKQHDAQEFILFLLNILHDLLNRATVKNRRRKTSENLTHIPISQMSEKDFSEILTGEVSKRLKMDHTGSLYDNDVPLESDTDAGVECEESISKAEKAWREHTCNNHSVIADSFSGQFQSVMSCEKCAFVSTTYEPFMILSLSIPHAMEKQIVVTWIPFSLNVYCLPGMVVAKKYLVTVNKNGCIVDVKKAFFSLLKKDDGSINTNAILFAEVSKSASVRLLDDRTQLSYLSKSKDVCAMEAVMANILENTTSQNYQHDNSKVSEKIDNFNKTAESAAISVSSWHSCNICLEEIFDDEIKVHTICGCLLCESCLEQTVAMTAGEAFPCPLCGRIISEDDYTPLVDSSSEQPTKSSSMVCTSQNNTNGDVKAEASATIGSSTWHVCSICLEETFDEDIKVHPVCGGHLCTACLQNTVDFHEHKKFPCPICSEYISAEEYESLVEPSETKNLKKRLRQLLVPIMFRHDALDETSRKFELFGYPIMCSLLSEVKSTDIVELIKHVLYHVYHLSLKYDILITDGTGLSCGRCEMLSSCTGCRVTDHEVLMLKPGFCVTVHFYENLDAVVSVLNYCAVDNSMNERRTRDDVALEECLQAFGDVELLTEENPWFCPKCQANQFATKHITVTRWPKFLIIHLKRFYFEGNVGCKITCPVNYPLKDLNVDVLSCVGNISENMTSTKYDLYSVIRHTGTLYGGHYTCFAKPDTHCSSSDDDTCYAKPDTHCGSSDDDTCYAKPDTHCGSSDDDTCYAKPDTHCSSSDDDTCYAKPDAHCGSSDDDWYYFNDESFQKMKPGEDNNGESYVLFYQRTGTDFSSLYTQMEKTVSSH